MIQIDLCKVSLPLKKKFVVSKGQAEIKTNLLAILNNRYSGEASGSVYYGPSVEEIETDLRRGIEYLQKSKELTIKTLEEIGKYDIKPIARSALVAMVLNYLSGETQRYPWELLSLGAPVGIKSSYTISIDTPEAVLAAIKESSFPIVKVKLGSDSDEAVVEILKEVGERSIRVDANGAWSCARAEEMIYYLSKLGIRVIEQPTDVSSISEWPHLKGKQTDVELVLDEGLNTLEDYEAFSQYADGVNIKMEKSGGVIEAIRIAQKARQDKKKVMLGCMVESSVGIAQSVYMSSLADYYDLDGPQLLADDIASGIVYQKELIQVDREIIGGPKLKRDVVDKYIQP